MSCFRIVTVVTFCLLLVLSWYLLPLVFWFCHPLDLYLFNQSISLVNGTWLCHIILKSFLTMAQLLFMCISVTSTWLYLCLLFLFVEIWLQIYHSTFISKIYCHKFVYICCIKHIRCFHFSVMVKTWTILQWWE